MGTPEFRDIEIPVSQLSMGMRVVELDCPWTETSFMYQGFVIRHPEELRELRNKCRRVRIRIKVQTLSSGSKRAGAQGARERIQYVDKVGFAEGVANAGPTYEMGRDFSCNLFESIRQGRAIDLKGAREVAERVVDSVLESAAALRFLSQIRNRDEYTAEHSLSVCVFTAAMGRALGLPEQEIKKAALGALLHDVGKAKIPLEILNKPGRLTREEALEMAQHPIHGRNLLLSLPPGERHAIDIAHAHHERPNGTGYPRKLTAEKIPLLAKIVSIVDAFDAMTSERPYGTVKSNHQAQSIILRNAGTQFDEEMAKVFVELIGRYPPGTLVTMQDGSIGIVVSARDTAKVQPRVLLVAHENGTRRAKEKLVDLEKAPKDDEGRLYQIVSDLPQGTHGIRLQEFLDKGLVLG
ncbi:HD-GYP domain-containing protein [Marinobacteraceae bacterium S3BR75-40.1]